MESYLLITWSPRKLVTLNPKLKSTGAGRYQLLSVGGMPTARLFRKTFRKVRTLHCSRLSDGALPMIDRGDIRQAPTVAAISGLHCRALVMVCLSIRLTAWLQIQRSGRNGQRDWCMSRVTAIISALLSASSSACHGLLIITVITPLPTKPSATKMPENWSWRTRQLPTCRCVSVMLLGAWCKIHEGVSDA